MSQPPSSGTTPPPLPRSSNRQRNDDAELCPAELTHALDQAIASQPSLELAVLYLIDRYKFDLNQLTSKLSGVAKGLDVSFSKIKYTAVAPFVGLNPDAMLRDVSTFDLIRARIPTPMFKEIVQDLQIVMYQYGPPEYHSTEEARSRFIALLMNRTIAKFKLLIRNTAEQVLPSRFATRGRTGYQFKVCGTIAILFIEVKRLTGVGEDRLSAIAQVITEAIACDCVNAKAALSSLIHVILSDGSSFEFFRFERLHPPSPSFSRGTVMRTDGVRSHKLVIPDFDTPSRSNYTCSLRPVCETIFWIFLQGYIAGLKAYYERAEQKSTNIARFMSDEPNSAAAQSHAHNALRMAVRAAEGLGADMADVEAARALAVLDISIKKAPAIFRRDDCDLVGGWDEALVARA